MSVKSEKLHGLQDLLIDEFITRIQSGEATPSDLNAARQLLKDNGIHAQVEANNPLNDLIKVLPFRGEDEIIKHNHG